MIMFLRFALLAVLTVSCAAFVVVDKAETSLNTRLDMTASRKGFSNVPDQGRRTTMNPFQQIEKFSAYPEEMESRRVYRASSPTEEEQSALPPAAPATPTSSEGRVIPSLTPDQGRRTTMNPFQQIDKFSMYPPTMDRNQ